MNRAAAFLLLALLSGGASADTVWNGTSASSITAGSGDILQTAGAALTLSAESTGTDKFAGAITSLDAGPFQGREVRLAGTVLVKDGAGTAALWVRADGAQGRLAFANSAGAPVHAGAGPQAREVQLNIPSGTTTLKLGVTLSSAGRVDVEHLVLTAEPAASGAVSAYDMVEYALSTIRANALNAGSVDWANRQEALLTPELKELPAQEAYGRIREVLDALADRHSFLQVPREALAYRQTAVATRPIEARQMQDIGYVLVPGLRGTDAGAGEAFATQLCEQVARLAPTSSRGWIIDLRQNTGGNMWPMLSGLHSLLGDGDIGAIRDRKGVVTPWRARGSRTCGVDLSRSRVAVLVGPKTASSGEAVAVAFRARPATRFFGQPTAGLATSNRAYALPDGGALRLTTAVMLDRSGAAYLQGITPESLVSTDQDAIDAAAVWLRSSP